MDGDYNKPFENFKNTSIIPPAYGGHNFSVRVKDSYGNWGPVYTTRVHIDTLTDASFTPHFIQTAEYFWNDDPGEGLGTPILAMDGDYNKPFENFKNTSIIPPAYGGHNFSVRVKDSYGNWGPVYTTRVHIDTLTDASFTSHFIQTAEYFWNDDPGEGLGTPILAMDGDYNKPFENFKNTSIIPPAYGGHNFGVRVKDSYGNWGPVYTTRVHIDTLTDASFTPHFIQTAEYFWNDDPGEGLGTPILAMDGDYNKPFENFIKNIPYPTNGTYQIGVRVLDNNNQWGVVYKTNIHIEIPNNDFEIEISKK